MWHFMRRIARRCDSELHPLYGVFMAHLQVSGHSGRLVVVNISPVGETGRVAFYEEDCS